ncbi:hypothetical protein Dpo_5c00840 [Desulfotignum phosphitoxidans DSM 13687]|uniref:Uncharacterized protein n=1 Tax=Desulfotignum phosphitoxidans DSM 13687 TaxID=1286635 RepID=S0G543_9BACT|nr:hypothetical protein Dpo_5c00840 [Desulfotignum phosphitoxidans DSM 13687]
MWINTGNLIFLMALAAAAGFAFGGLVGMW